MKKLLLACGVAGLVACSGVTGPDAVVQNAPVASHGSMSTLESLGPACTIKTINILVIGNQPFAPGLYFLRAQFVNANNNLISHGVCGLPAPTWVGATRTEFGFEATLQEKPQPYTTKVTISTSQTQFPGPFGTLQFFGNATVNVPLH